MFLLVFYNYNLPFVFNNIKKTPFFVYRNHSCFESRAPSSHSTSNFADKQLPVPVEKPSGIIPSYFSNLFSSDIPNSAPADISSSPLKKVQFQVGGGKL